MPHIPHIPHTSAFMRVSASSHAAHQAAHIPHTPLFFLFFKKREEEEVQKTNPNTWNRKTEDSAMKDDLFEIEFEAARNALVEEKHQKPRVQAMQRIARRQTRRARSTETLAEVFPQKLQPGSSWHFISQGDVDALSYLQLLVDHTPLAYLLFSTWCMAMDDVAQIGDWLKTGRITRVDAYCGEIFPSQYPDEHIHLADLLAQHGGRLAVFRNHSKVMVGYGEDGQGYVLESSANINTNPRAEQTALHIDTALADFYREFFDGIRSFDRSFDHIQPWNPAE